MKVRFDYHLGPEQGHAMRCKILWDELVRRGHEMAYKDADVLIYDHPGLRLRGRQNEPVGIILGTYGVDEFGWHPLGIPHHRTLTGLQYLILDPALGEYTAVPKQDYVLVTMGGGDKERHTEMVLDALMGAEDNVCVVQGPQFGRNIRETATNQHVYDDLTRLDFLSMLAAAGDVVCAWGTTALEAAYLGARVFVVAREEWQMEEARRTGFKAYYPFDAWERLGAGQRGMTLDSDFRVELDLLGAERTVDWMEMLHEVYGGKDD